jgi:hypothetical protein
MAVEQSGRGERAYDIYSRLLEERVVFLVLWVTIPKQWRWPSRPESRSDLSRAMTVSPSRTWTWTSRN